MLRICFERSDAPTQMSSLLVVLEFEAAVLAWREATADNGLINAQIERIASAFEHKDLAKAIAWKTVDASGYAAASTASSFSGSRCCSRNRAVALWRARRSQA